VSRSDKRYRKICIYDLTVDFITNLPLVAKKNTILVVCNRLSKMDHFIATIEKMLVERSTR